MEKLAVHLGNLSVKARADIQDLDEQPTLKNAEFSSEFPLADLIPLIPWKQLGEQGPIIRSALEDGGNVIIEKVSLPEIDLAGPSTTLEALLPRIHMVAQVSGSRCNPHPMSQK